MKWIFFDKNNPTPNKILFSKNIMNNIKHEENINVIFFICLIKTPLPPHPFSKKSVLSISIRDIN